MDILAIVGKREQKVQNTVSNEKKPPILQSIVCVSNQGRSPCEASHTTRPQARMQSKGVE